jgi:hypothetical protein
MSQTTKTIVARQRMLLQSRLAGTMQKLAAECAHVWPDRPALERCLAEGLAHLPWCKHLFVLDGHARQLTANVSPAGPLPDYFGRDRSKRPYLSHALAGDTFSLSDAYISRNARRPSLTAVQRILDGRGALLGFLGADFDLRELPLTRELYTQPEQWLQLKGDPAIRGSLFFQQRVESLLDRHIDEVLDLLTELIAVHGVFHSKLHFSSSRATLWLINDPFRYRILDFDDLADPGICLVYPRHPYPQDAVIPLSRIREVLNRFRELRFIDENIYLRSGSLNIFNGIVGLNFSCDGSHYIPWSEFLSMSMDFWIGSGEICAVEDADDPQRSGVPTAPSDAAGTAGDAGVSPNS